MIKNETIDNKKPIDARVVQTVRKLKSINSNNPNNNNENNIHNSNNKKNKKSENDLPKIERGFSKKGTKISTAERSVINSINNGASIPGSANYLKKQDSKISIDGSLHNSINQKLINNNINIINNNINVNNNYSNNFIFENNNNKHFIKQNSFNNNNFNIKKKFDYETLKKFIKKPKTEYQKNILSENNIIKYKTECINLIKKDKELKNLLTKVGINNNKDEYENYINDTLFNKEYFLVALEMLLLEESQESNTLAVFRKNKNQLPLKVLKENFYKDFMLKDLNKKIYDSDYNYKYKNFIKILDEKIENVKNFKIIK